MIVIDKPYGIHMYFVSKGVSSVVPEKLRICTPTVKYRKSHCHENPSYVTISVRQPEHAENRLQSNPYMHIEFDSRVSMYRFRHLKRR